MKVKRVSIHCHPCRHHVSSFVTMRGMKRLLLIPILLLACHAPRPHGVTIARAGKASARVLVTTVGVAIKETGPPVTVKQFGEVYAFSPATFAVRRDQPTQITFWNLQPDDEHDFMLTDPQKPRPPADEVRPAVEDDVCHDLPRRRRLPVLLHDAPASDVGTDHRYGAVGEPAAPVAPIQNLMDLPARRASARFRGQG